MASSNLRDGITGGFGAVCLVATGQPFDTVRVRQQTRPDIFRGPIHCAVLTASEEGVLALWRGAMPALSSSVLENTIAFAVNGYLRRLLHLSDDSPFLAHAAIGAAGGVISATAICPAEVVKVRMQFQRSNTGQAYRSGTDCMMQILKKEGPRGAFAGLLPLLLRDVPFNAIFFGSYRSYRSLLGSRVEGSGAVESTPQLAMFCGGLAGATAWTVVLPLDALKSRAQVAAIAKPGTERPAAAQIISELWRAGGIRAFYRGWSATVARAFVANSALFLGLNMSERWYDAAVSNFI